MLIITVSRMIIIIIIITAVRHPLLNIGFPYRLPIGPVGAACIQCNPVVFIRSSANLVCEHLTLRLPVREPCFVGDKG